MYRLTVILLLNIPFYLSGQVEIPLLNPSFEENGEPQIGGITPKYSDGFVQPEPTEILYWNDAGQEGETPPDIHSAETDFFRVKHAPFEGRFFLGMVTRANGTYEALSQALSSPIVPGNTYQLSFAAAQAEEYVARTRTDPVPQVFVAPTVLRVWGANSQTRQFEVLAESPVIDHIDWKVYILSFSPKEDSYDNIIIGAYWYDPDKYTKGHLLLDAFYLVEISGQTIEKPSVEVRNVITSSSEGEDLIISDTAEEKFGEVYLGRKLVGILYKSDTDQNFNNVFNRYLYECQYASEQLWSSSIGEKIKAIYLTEELIEKGYRLGLYKTLSYMESDRLKETIKALQKIEATTTLELARESNQIINDSRQEALSKKQRKRIKSIDRNTRWVDELSERVEIFIQNNRQEIRVELISSE